MPIELRTLAAGRRDLRVAVFVVFVTAAVVTGLDGWLSARVATGADTALRLSVIEPYLGVDSTYVLARCLGIAALLAATAALILAVESGRRRTGGRRPPPVLAVLHRQVALVTLALAAGHATVPYLAAVPPQGGWSTALVPLAQPFAWGRQATLAESAGILAFYLAVLVGPTYYLLRRRRRTWVILHRCVLVVYVLAVLHVLFLGSDFLVAGVPRVALIAAQVPLLGLGAARLRTAASAAGPLGPLLTAGAVVALAGSAALAILAALGAGGAAVGGMRL